VLDWGPDPPTPWEWALLGVMLGHARLAKLQLIFSVLFMRHEETAVMRPPATSTVAPGCSVELVAGDVQLL